MPSFTVPVAGAAVAADAGATAAAVGTAAATTAATTAAVAAPAAAAATGLSTLGYASLASGAIGAATSAIGAINSADASGKAAAYSAQVAQNNSIIAGNNAEAATQAGQARAANQGLQDRAKLAATISSEAASGTDVDTGSNKQVVQSQEELNQLDVATTINNAALTAYGYRSGATGFQAQSALDTATAQQAPTAAALGGASSLFQGASSLGLNTAKLQSTGAI
jgi:hypothetical protein